MSEQCAAVFSQFQDLKVILCHAGSPYNRSTKGIAAWAEDLKHLSNLENVSCKLSGLGMFEHSWTETSVKPIAKTVINQFGPKRVMFGSNFPVDSLSSSFDDLYMRLNNIIGTQNSEDIFFQTAQQTYFSKLSIS